MRVTIHHLVAAITVGSIAGVASSGVAANELQNAIEDCRRVTTAIARLDCYDAIALTETAASSDSAQAESPANPEADVPAGESAPAAAGVASAATAAVAATADERANEEEEFGLELDVKDALQSVTSEVTAERANAKGGLVLTLANGQVWQQMDGQKLFLDVGDTVTIERGALSAFYLTRDGKGRRYKFSRVQ